MGYYIFKLNFNTGIHFGTTKGSMGLDQASYFMRSDTFFSAFISEYVKMYGNESIKSLSESIENGDLLFSDLMPYVGTKLYVPKPYMHFEREPVKRKEIESSVLKKHLKKIDYIPIEELDTFLEQQHQSDINLLEIPDFGEFELITKNKINVGENTELYSVEMFKFKKDSGLYFVLKCDESFYGRLIDVVECLSFTGIGGKRSSGYGSFELYTDPIELFMDDDLEVESISDLILKRGLKMDGQQRLLISSLLPTQSDVDALTSGISYYGIIKRSGFVNSIEYSSTPQKRKQVYMISSGSILDFVPEGRVVDLNLHGKHSILRVGKPISIGVNVDE